MKLLLYEWGLNDQYSYCIFSLKFRTFLSILLLVLLVFQVVFLLTTLQIYGVDYDKIFVLVVKLKLVIVLL